jgi:hypothetical protein
MNNAKHCAECEQIATEAQAAFLKLIFTRPKTSNVPTRQDFNRYLSELFSSEAELARLQEQWQQSESGRVYQVDGTSHRHGPYASLAKCHRRTWILVGMWRMEPQESYTLQWGVL